MKLKSIAALLAAIMCLPVLAAGADISVGAGGAFSSSPYKRHDDSMLPVPLITYEGERFYVRGASAGIHVWKEGQQTVSLGASYSWLHFNPGDTSDPRLRRLDKRYSTVMADLSYTLATQWGVGRVKLSRDILGHSDAFTGDASYRYPFHIGELTLSPGAGVQWASEKQADYYFGVSTGEARKSGLDRYDPNDSFSPYLMLDARYRLSPQWSVMAGGQVLFLSDEIKNSPMVDTDHTTSVMVGMQYSF